MAIDKKKLKHTLKQTAEELRAIKKIYRDSTQQPPASDTISTMLSKKREAHLLCTLTAHSRGRVHLRPTKAQLLETQRDFLAGQCLDEFMIPDEPTVEELPKAS